MQPKLATLILFAGVALASCARDETTAVAQASTPDAMPALLGPRAGAGGILQVTRVTCHQLLAAPAHDREAAMMFYYGYFVAGSGKEDVDTSKIDGDLHRVADQCSRNPNLTVNEAFRGRLTTGPIWFWQ